MRYIKKFIFTFIEWSILLSFGWLKIQILLSERIRDAESPRVGKEIANLTRMISPKNIYFLLDYERRLIENQKNFKRELPGIDYNVARQIELLHDLSRIELLPFEKKEIDNSPTIIAEQDLLLRFITWLKPKRIVELGYDKLISEAIISTVNSINANSRSKIYHSCFEMPFQKVGVPNNRINEINDYYLPICRKAILDLKESDLLVINLNDNLPSTQFLVEVLVEVLPKVKKHVYIRFSNVHTPFDFFDDWIKWNVSFWNSQYMVEAFMTNNSKFEMQLSTNFINHLYPDLMSNLFNLKENGYKLDSLLIKSIG